MDGDIAPIHAICDLAEKYAALTYLDRFQAFSEAKAVVLQLTPR